MKASIDLILNIKEALTAIQANWLRTILTALIVAIGITSLVGILTAVDGIKASINQSFSSLGGNTFDIKTKQENRRGRRRGVIEKAQPPIRYREASQFKQRFGYADEITIFSYLTRTAEIKWGSKKTNPNVTITGVDQNYLVVQDYDLINGRNFSGLEIRNGTDVIIIGNEIKDHLFNNSDPINQSISLLGSRFRVIGVLKEQGGISRGGVDRSIFIPLENARRLAQNRELRFQLKVSLNEGNSMGHAMGEAVGLMRIIRRDKLGQPPSFEVVRSKSLAQRLDKMTGYLRIGGFSIGFITLLGASIALMNIMLVSVTERTQEIGIRKALGATPQKIQQQFLVEAIVICQIGGLAGVLFGIAMGNVVSQILGAGTFVVPWLWIAVGLLLGFVVGIISGYIPARKAANLDPIESLRFE